jgi:hypothetical protein
MQSVLSAALPAPAAAVEEAVEVEETLLSRQARWNSPGGARTALQVAVGDGLHQEDLGGLATMFKDELLLVSKSLSCCLRTVKEGATAVVKDELPSRTPLS